MQATSDAEEATPNTQKPLDGGIDACPKGHKGHAQVDHSSTFYRLVYLSFSLVAVLLIVAAGIFVHQDTNSLSVMFDCLASGADAVSLLFNIAMELLKSRVSSQRTILVLDFVGYVTSMVLLLGVATFGVIAALARTEEAESTHLRHVNDLIVYSVFVFSMSCVCLMFFCVLRGRMLPGRSSASDVVPDDLNVVSALLHSVTDFVGNFTILVVALYLKYGHLKELASKRAAQNVLIDACGALVVCACIVGSIALFYKDAAETWNQIRRLPDEEQFGLSEHDAEKSKATSYGTIAQRVQS